MALEALVARANTGEGTDQLAVVNTAAGKAGAVALVNGLGDLIDPGHPLAVEVQNFPNTQPVSAAALPLPTGAATNASLVEVRDRLPVATSANPLDTVVATPVRQAPQKYTDISFSQVGAGLLSSDMAQIGPVGTGMAVNQSAGNLVITTGTTANAEVTLRSVASFNGALTLKEVTTLSQRIANNNFFVELVDVVGDGLAYTIVNATTVDVTRPAHGFTALNVGQRMDIGVITGAAGIPMEAVIASIPNADTIRFTVAGWPATGTGTCSLTGYNKIELNYTGTVATAVNFNTRRRGWQNVAVAGTINTTAAAHMGIVNVENGVASLADKVVTSAGVIANRASWDTNIPRTNETLFLQIRARNGTVAPASTTTWTVGMLRVEDYIPTQVSLVSTRVQSIQNAAPVAVIGSATVAGTVNVAGAGITGGVISPLTVAGVSAEASAARTASGNSATALTNASGRNAHFFVNVTAATGTTPTLVVRVQIQDPVGLGWIDLPGAATASITGTGLTLLTVTNLPRTYRLAWVIGGTTPSFTFSVGIAPVI